MEHSPPKSPNDVFHQKLPLSDRGSTHYYSNSNSHRRPSGSGTLYADVGDYSSGNTKTPSIDQSRSAPAMAIDCMSFDGNTNPQTGCLRSEGGKGFKRKSDTALFMVPHVMFVLSVLSLQRYSPFSCRLCLLLLERIIFAVHWKLIHKFRHVRALHPDKDKDDPQLREVLSQKSKEPSRKGRRGGGTSWPTFMLLCISSRFVDEYNYSIQWPIPAFYIWGFVQVILRANKGAIFMYDFGVNQWR